MPKITGRPETVVFGGRHSLILLVSRRQPVPPAGQPGDGETERGPRDGVAERPHAGEHAGRNAFPNELQHGRVEAHQEVYRAGPDEHAGGQQPVGRAGGRRHRAAKPVVTTLHVVGPGTTAALAGYRSGSRRNGTTDTAALPPRDAIIIRPRAKPYGEKIKTTFVRIKRRRRILLFDQTTTYFRRFFSIQCNDPKKISKRINIHYETNE